MINISIYGIKTINHGSEEISQEGDSLNLDTLDDLPDIYFIIVDSYARQSTLKEIYNYDNSEFIDYLTNKGFYVAAKSRSNYAQTNLSLTSSLNMEYIGGTESQGISIANNKASQFLKAKGYRYIFVSGGFFSKDMSEYADVYLPQRGVFGLGMTNFAVGLIQTTALQPFRSLIGIDARNDMLYVYDTLADMPNIKGPKFVVAHTLGVHTPFVFGRNGNPAIQTPLRALDVPQYYQKGYVDQLILINKKLEKLIDEVLSKSDVEPIIILQADTGPGSTQQQEVPYNKLSKLQLDERMNIFNAYFLPKNGNRLLYESITPVNSFRVIFNLYFDANYHLLKDESYFSNYDSPYKFILVPPERNAS